MSIKVIFLLQNRGRYSMPTTPTPMDKANYGVMRRAIPAHIGEICPLEGACEIPVPKCSDLVGDTLCFTILKNPLNF